MDVLTEVMESIHLRSTIYCRARLSAPWGVFIGARREVQFHVVTEGRCWLAVEGIPERLRLDTGDFVLLPHGNGHTMRDAPDTFAPPLEEIIAAASFEETDGELVAGGGGPPGAALLCGYFPLDEADGVAANPLLAALPPLIHIRGEDGQAGEWLRGTVEFILCEVKHQRPGAQTVLTRLTDILFIQAVRAYIAGLPACDGGWLRAAIDPQIGPVLSLVHRQPDAPWAVESLARHAAMSRSAFAARFRDLVGEPPLRYVTRWRMNKASALLRETQQSLSQIAETVGYESEAAFSKAFKAWAGTPPGAYRFRQRTAA